MKKEIEKYKKISAGFIKDFSYIRFVIIVIDSGGYLDNSKNVKKIDKATREDLNEINNLYKNILKSISRDDFNKIEKKTIQITENFIKNISNRADIENIFVLLFAIYVLKYRFYMFKNKKVSDDLAKIVEKKRLVRLIKNLSKTLPENRSIHIEVNLAKKISIAF